MSDSTALQVGVKAIISNSEGDILLLRRSEEKYGKDLGHWDIPGGRIVSGETLLNNLRREVLEETGLSISDEIELLHAQDILLPDMDRHVVRLTYSVGCPENFQISLDESENTKYQWLSIAAARKLNDINMYLKEVLDDL